MKMSLLLSGRFYGDSSRNITVITDLHLWTFTKCVYLPVLYGGLTTLVLHFIVSIPLVKQISECV